MKFEYKGKHKSLKQAVEYANTLKNEPDFWVVVRNKGQFHKAKDGYTADHIANLLMNHSEPVVVETVIYPAWHYLYWVYRFKETTGVTLPGKKNHVFLVQRRLDRSIAALVNTLVHEYIHVVDGHIEPELQNFGHGENKRQGNEDTAPYWIGDHAENYYNK